MLNRSAERGSEHLALPGIMPSILLMWHLITSGLAFIITNAKPDFVPFEDSGSSSGSIIIRRNNYVALKERKKNKKSSCLVLLSCGRNSPAAGAARQHFTSLKSLRPQLVRSLRSLFPSPGVAFEEHDRTPHSFLPSSPRSHSSIRTRASACTRRVEKNKGALGGAGGWAGKQEEKITGSSHLPDPSWSSAARSLPTQPWFVSQWKRLRFRALYGMTHHVFCWSPSGVRFLQFGADCILHVMEETVFSALYLGFLGERMCSLASLLLLCSSLPNQSTFILQNFFP